MRKAINLILPLFNIVLFFILLFHIGIGGLSAPPPGWEYKDLITIILTALGVLLGALAIFIGLLAVWGYASIRDAATKAAADKADAIAREVAEPVAARVAEEVAARNLPAASGDALTVALSSGGPK